MTRCRHRQSWLIAGAAYEWCYQCGAFRHLRHLTGNQVAVASPWCKPTGPDGENPHEQWMKRVTTWTQRKRRTA